MRDCFWRTSSTDSGWILKGKFLLCNHKCIHVLKGLAVNSCSVAGNLSHFLAQVLLSNMQQVLVRREYDILEFCTLGACSEQDWMVQVCQW